MNSCGDVGHTIASATGACAKLRCLCANALRSRLTGGKSGEGILLAVRAFPCLFVVPDIFRHRQAGKGVITKWIVGVDAELFENQGKLPAQELLDLVLKTAGAM